MVRRFAFPSATGPCGRRPDEIAQIQPYGPQGQTLTPAAYSYDPAGNQTGNNGGGTGKPLSIGYYPTNQTQAISDVNQNPETMTWAGAGQAERVKRSWADSGTNYTATYTWSLLGLSGYSNTGVGEPKNTTSVTSWIIRDPYGTPVAQRYSNGSEYYYLFDGQGDVVGLEDPGAMQAAYDFCPTGNEADLASTLLTAVALGNPLRQYSQVYDDLTKDYFGANGWIAEDYSGTGIQTPGIMYGDVLQAAPSRVSLRSFDYGTAAAGVVNLGLGVAKTTLGSIDILGGGEIPAALPFPANLVAGPVTGSAAVAVGVYQITTGVARENRAIRQFRQVATTPAVNTSVEGNVARFVSGVGPFGLPKAPTVQDILSNLP